MSVETRSTSREVPFYEPIRRYILRLVRDPDAADDIVQDVFVRFESKGGAIEQSRQRSWLYSVARNLVIDRFRRSKLIEQAADDPDTMPGEATLHDPSLLAEKKEMIDMVLEKLNDLPARQREVVRLKFQEGLSYNEIADVTGQTRSTVGYLLHDAMTRLRKMLKAA